MSLCFLEEKGKRSYFEIYHGILFLSKTALRDKLIRPCLLELCVCAAHTCAQSLLGLGLSRSVVSDSL